MALGVAVVVGHLPAAALILGHAVPMPVVIRTREYNEAFFAAVSPLEAQRSAAVQSGAPIRDPLADLFE